MILINSSLLEEESLENILNKENIKGSSNVTEGKKSRSKAGEKVLGVLETMSTLTVLQ